MRCTSLMRATNKLETTGTQTTTSKLGWALTDFRRNRDCSTFANSLVLNYILCGAGCRSRTRDLRFTKSVLLVASSLFIPLSAT